MTPSAWGRPHFSLDVWECVECGSRSVSDDGTWKPGQFCLFGSLFCCSRACGERWATENAAVGFRPGEPGFRLEEPGKLEAGL